MIDFKLSYHFSTESTTVRCTMCDEARRQYRPLGNFTGKELYEWMDQHARGYHNEVVPKEWSTLGTPKGRKANWR